MPILSELCFKYLSKYLFQNVTVIYVLLLISVIQCIAFYLRQNRGQILPWTNFLAVCKLTHQIIMFVLQVSPWLSVPCSGKKPVEKRLKKPLLLVDYFIRHGRQKDGQFHCPTYVSWATVHAAAVARLVTEWWRPARIAVAVPVVVTHLQSIQQGLVKRTTPFWTRPLQPLVCIWITH